MGFGIRGVVSALLLGASAVAHAQAEPSDASAADTPAVERGGDAEIIVTGEKFNRSLQDTPTSVRVVTTKDIENENLTDLFDIVNRTANLSSTFAGTGFNIRGINNRNVSGSGTGDLATVYLDGSALPREAVDGGPLDLWDLAQVEVLRGPQSTLQGRNALAGAIILRTTDPSYNWTGKARALLTNEENGRRFSAAIGGPIITDQLAFRVAAEQNRADGLIYNPTLKIDDGLRASETIRAKLLFTPTAIPDLRVLLTYMHDRHVRGTDYSFSDTPDYWTNRLTLGNRRTLNTVKSDIATADISYKLSSAVTLSSITTYNRIATATEYDGDNLPIDTAYGDFANSPKTFSEELRLTFDAGRLTGVLGGYYSRLSNQDYNAHSVFKLNVDRDLGLTARLVDFGLSLPTAQFVTSLYPPDISIDTNQSYPQTVTTMAAFGDATWAVTDRLKLHGGFRYDREKQVASNNNTVVLVEPLPDPAAYAAIDPSLPFVITTVNNLLLSDVANANSSSPPNETLFEAFLPKLGFSYEVADDKTLSFTVQRGYRSGGSGINPGRARVFSYNPEYTWNYEFALRTLWLDRRLSINANAFYIDWKNQQVNVRLSQNVYDTETRNAGKSRVYGLELESRFQATGNLGFYASLGYANTKFEDFAVAGGITDNLTGNEFANAPQWTWAAGGTWQHPKGWFVNLNASYRSSSFSDVAVQTVRDIPARTLVNAKIGWQNDRVGAFLTASNIFDEKYSDYGYQNDTRFQSMLGKPRIIGISLEGRF